MFHLLLASFAALMGTRVSDFLLDEVVASGIEQSTLQVADSAFQFTVAVATIAWGVMVDGFPRQRKVLFVAGNITWIFGGILLAASPVGVQTLLAAEVTWGAGFAALGPIVASYLGDMFGVNRRGRLFAAYTTILYLIKGSATAVTGLVGEALGDWRYSNLSFALVGAGAMLAFLAKARPPKLGAVEPELVDLLPSYEVNFRFHRSSVPEVLRTRTNALLLLQGVCGMIGVTIVTRYLSYWFTATNLDGLGVSTGVAVLFLGAAGAGGALAGILVAGHFVDRQFRSGKHGRALWFATGCVFAQVAAYAILLLAPRYSPPTAAAAGDLVSLLSHDPAYVAFLFGFNLATFFGTPVGTTVGIARTHANLPEHRGTAAALYDTTDFVGAGVGLLLGAAMLAATGSYRLVVVLGSTAWLLSGALWVLAARTFGRDWSLARERVGKRAARLVGAGEKATTKTP
ncbi:MAG: hypothetical protein Kow0069_01140 [Promethearchaeota archaeon]